MAASSAIHVVPVGLSPTFWAIVVATIPLVGILIRQWVPLKRAQIEADDQLLGHYGAELKALRQQILDQGARHADALAAAEARYAEMLRSSIEREHDCQAEVTALRARVRGLEERIAGLGRQIAQVDHSAISLLPSTPEHIAEAADRAAAAIERRDRTDTD